MDIGTLQKGNRKVPTSTSAHNLAASTQSLTELSDVESNNQIISSEPITSSAQSSPEVFKHSARDNRITTLSPTVNCSIPTVSKRNNYKLLNTSIQPVRPVSPSAAIHQSSATTMKKSDSLQIIQILTQLEEKQNTARKFFDEQQSNFNSEISKLKDLIKKL